MKRWLTVLLCLCAYVQAEEPWGTDCELVGFDPCEVRQTHSPGSMFAQALIAFHQNIISPADGPRSHFFPSSSQYALEAIRKHGVLRGIPMGCDRLMRENNEEWVYRKIWHQEQWYKYDPVP